MRLYLIRHPKPLVPAGVCYGSSDIEVDRQDLERVVRDLTRSQMEVATPIAVAASLISASDSVSASLPKRVAIYSSPLQRCVNLTQYLASTDGTVATFDGRLAEMDFGNWELCNWDDIPRVEIDAWAADLTTYQPGGGESVSQMAKRVHAFYLDVLHKKQDAIVVCHAGTIRLLLACQHSRDLESIALYAAKNPIKIGYGQVVVMSA